MKTALVTIAVVVLALILALVLLAPTPGSIAEGSATTPAEVVPSAVAVPKFGVGGVPGDYLLYVTGTPTNNEHPSVVIDCHDAVFEECALVLRRNLGNNEKLALITGSSIEISATRDSDGASIPVHFNARDYFFKAGELGETNSLLALNGPGPGDQAQIRKHPDHQGNIFSIKSDGGSDLLTVHQVNGARVAMPVAIDDATTLNGVVKYGIQQVTYGDNKERESRPSDTFQPVASFVAIACNDPDGCEVVLPITGNLLGAQVALISTGPFPVFVPDLPDVMELAGNAKLETYDVLRLALINGRWVELTRSDN